MANIPLAQIPNAPQTGNMAVPVPVGAIRTPNVATMPVLGQNVFSGAERGLAGLAQGGADIASAAMQGMRFAADFSDKMQKANDDFNMATADRLWSEARADHSTEVSTMTPDKYSTVWQEKYLPKLQNQLKEMPMSQTGRARLDAWQQGQIGNSYAAITTGANKEFLNRGRTEVVNAAERAVAEGRAEDAYGQIGRGVANGYLSPEEADAYMLKFEQQAKWETVEQKVSMDPHTAAFDLQQAVDSNKEHPDFPELKTQADRVKALRAARGFERENISRYSGQALERVLQGDFQNAEEIEKAYTGLLPTKEIEELKATLSQTPEEVAKRVELYRPVLAMIETYDPSTDKDLSARMEIRRAIRQVETGFQLDLVNSLNDKVRQNKPLPPTSVNTIRKDLEDRLKAGEYGSWKTDKEGNPRNDAERAKYENAMLAYGQEATAFNEWSRKNPGASDADAFTEINRIRMDQYKRDKAAGRDPKMPAAMQAPKVQDIENEIRRRRGRSRPPAAEDNTLDQIESMDLSQAAFEVTDQTRDQIGKKSTPQARQVALDFNSGGPQSRGVEIVIPSNATPEEKAAAQEYTTALTAWFKSKGVDVPNRGVLAKTGSGKSVPRFHTEPFFVQDAESRKAIEADPDGYARVLVATLGRLPVTFIAPHTSTDGGAADGDLNEREFARTVIIPALRRVQGGEVMLAQR